MHKPNLHVTKASAAGLNFRRVYALVLSMLSYLGMNDPKPQPKFQLIKKKELLSAISVQTQSIDVVIVILNNSEKRRSWGYEEGQV